jgi:hypothetical protein
MQVTDRLPWLMLSCSLLSGVLEVWYAIISAIPGANPSTDMVADVERDARLRARSVWL